MGVAADLGIASPRVSALARASSHPRPDHPGLPAHHAHRPVLSQAITMEAESEDTGPDDAARALLAAERAAVVTRMAAAQVDVNRLIGAGQDVATDDEHDPEGVGLAIERAHAVAALQRARDQLTRIDKAEERLARGGYGRCLVCGQPIPAERLQALPTATTCTGCSPARRPTTRRNT